MRVSAVVYPWLAYFFLICVFYVIFIFYRKRAKFSEIFGKLPNAMLGTPTMRAGLFPPGAKKITPLPGVSRGYCKNYLRGDDLMT